MKRSTQLAELQTPVKHKTLHKATARGALGRKMGVDRTKKSLRITWVKTTHGHHGRELAQHAHSREIARTHAHTVTSTQLQPRCAKRQFSYYRS